MAQKGLMPSNIFQIQISIEEVYKRTAPFAESDFACDRVILAGRLKNYNESQPYATYFYQKYYNNVLTIDGFKSKWFMLDAALKQI